MTGLAARAVGYVTAAALVATLSAALATGGGPLAVLRESVERGQARADRLDGQPTRSGRRDRDRGPGARPGDSASSSRGLERLLEQRQRLVKQAAVSAWRLVRLPTLLAALALVALSALRLWARHRRRYVRRWLVPYRADEATPDQVRRLLESWHQIVLRRWWRRLPLGQPSICLELHALPDAGGTSIQVAVACEPGLVDALDGRLVACYRDSRLVPAARLRIATAEVVRLKKRRSFIRRLATAESYDGALVDALSATMAACSEPCTVQYALTPTPAVFDRYARWLFRREERGLEQARVRAEGADPGTRSEVAQQELEGGLEVQHRPLFFAELRVSAPSYRSASAVAGTLRGESGAENRLVERQIRLRRRLYAARIAAARGNPLPSFARGVVSSSELAGLWQLPSPFLKGVRIERSSVPRVPAPPEILRPPADRALARDERGHVGLRDEDKRMNLMLLGSQGTGKTSVMCRAIADDASDPNCAVIVLDGKSDLALKALSVIPEELEGGRRVHYLDFARPEIGIDPFSADADRDAVADGIVEAFKDVHEEGSIQASSDRYLRQAAIACMGWTDKTGAGPATLWDMWTLLLPGAEQFRQQVVAAIGTDPELAAAAMFFGEQLPDQLSSARTQFAPRLDSPVNKLQKLTGQPRLDAILRHPVSLDIDALIRARDVLVVSGAAGAFGEGSARVLLQFLLHMVHRALIRQQELPEQERARVALKVDEAHLLFSPTFARMLAMDRSAGLECTAAWQALGQIEQRELRSVILNLLRHRMVFALADDDARAMADMFQTAYADVIHDSQQARARMRITPDALMNLPNFQAACSWYSRGQRVPSFIATTLPMRQHNERIEHHLEAQRERGAHYPGPLPPPQRLAEHLRIADFVPRANGDQPAETHVVPADREATAANGEGPGKAGVRSESKPRQPAPAAAAKTRPPASPDSHGEAGAGSRTSRRPPAVADFAPERSSHDDHADRAGIAPLGSGLPAVPGTYTELELDNPTGLRWQQRPPGPHKPPLPRKDDFEVLAALYELRFLYASQIARRFMPGLALRSVQNRLGLMFKAGWVSRAEITTGRRGHNQRLYALDERGFELVRQNAGRTALARELDLEAKFRAPEVSDPRVVLHDLHANAWLFALESTLRPGVLERWRGPRSSRLDPPREKLRGQWAKLTAERVPVGTHQRLDGLLADEFEPVRPDLTVELDLSLGGQPRRVDLLVELDRSRRASSNYEKFVRYDALITGWALSLPRYKAIGEPPVVVFVVEDDDKARQFLGAADTRVTGRIGTYGVPEAKWPHHGRRRIFFVAERDIHHGLLRALRLPEHPPMLRKAVIGKGAEQLTPEQVPSLLPATYVRRISQRC
jgi:Replication-relaxation